MKMKDFIKKLFVSEILRYGISGGCVTLTNALFYFILLQFGVIYTVANIISLILSKMVGYFLNKFWVYRSRCDSLKEAFFELLRFIGARGVTGLVDFFGVILLVEVFCWGERISKIILMLLVIILNYILGKKAVFVKGDGKKRERSGYSNDRA